MTDERLLAFTRSFADAVRSGLPPAQTLRGLANIHGRAFAAAADAVEKGETLHAALGARRALPPLLLALVRAGEESGKLDAFLDRYAAALDSRIDFRRRLSRALLYPAFAAGLAAALFLAISTKALPMILEPLMELGAEIPPHAILAMRAGSFVVAHWLELGCGAVVAWLLLGALARSYPGRAAFALAGHWLPGARYACEEARHHDFEATLELLLAAGLRPRQIVELLVETFSHDLVIRGRLSAAARLLEEGRTYTEALGPCVPEEDRSRVAVAERAGRLDEALAKMAQSHRDLQLHRLKQTATAVQLAALVALAPVVFGLLMTIAAPALSAFGPAAKQLGTIDEPKQERVVYSETSPLETKRSREASRFNESNAPRVTARMPGEKKSFNPPRLKSASSMGRSVRMTTVSPTSVGD